LFLTRDEIKEIRRKFQLTEKELGQMVGVTQTSISRYESGSAKPTGDIEKKLIQLKNAIQDPKESAVLRDLLSSAGGLAAAAGILGLGTVSLSSGLAAGFIAGSALMATGPIGLLTGAAGLTLYKTLKKLFENKQEE
jgi:DNA-binding XRE family transcriptional regulator